MTEEQAVIIDAVFDDAFGIDVEVVAGSTTIDVVAPGRLETSIEVIGLTADTQIQGEVNITIGNIVIETDNGVGTGEIAVAEGLKIVGDVTLVPRDGALDVVFENPRLVVEPEAPDATLLAGGSDEVTEIGVSFDVGLENLPDGAGLDIEFAKDPTAFVDDVAATFSLAAGQVLGNGQLDSDDDIAFVVQVTRRNIAKDDLGNNTITMSVNAGWVQSRQAAGKVVAITKIDDEGNVFSAVANCVIEGDVATCTATLVGEAGGFSVIAVIAVTQVLEPGQAEVSNLTVSPASVGPGEPVTVSFVVTNVGEDLLTTTIPLLVNAVEEQSFSVVDLAAGQTTTFTATVTRNEAGSYVVTAGGASGVFAVVVDGEAQFSDLTITPDPVIPGQAVNISFVVTNVGAGVLNTTAEVRINGALEQNFSIAGLGSGDSTTLRLTVARDEPGTYTVAAGPLTGSFTVLGPGVIEFSDLTVSSDSVPPGTAVTVSFVVTNIGERVLNTSAALRVNGQVEETFSITELAPGASTTLTATVTKSEAGSYTVAAGDLTASFTVLAPGVAELSDLSVSPESVAPGAPVAIAFVVANGGQLPLTTSVELSINGTVEERFSIADLVSGASATQSLSVTRDDAGEYNVTVGNLSATFTVVGPTPTVPVVGPTPTPAGPVDGDAGGGGGGLIIIIVIAAVVVIGGAGGFLFLKSRSGGS